MPQVRAWVLEVDNGLRAAVGNHHMMEYVSAPELVPIPLTPLYARGAMIWQQQIIPVIELSGMLLPGAPGDSGSASGVVIVAFQDAPGEALKHGGLLVQSAPNNVAVREDQGCALPATPPGWTALAAACFSDDRGPVPILNVANVFAPAPHGTRDPDPAGIARSAARGHSLAPPSRASNADPLGDDDQPTADGDAGLCDTHAGARP